MAYVLFGVGIGLAAYVALLSDWNSEDVGLLLLGLALATVGFCWMKHRKKQKAEKQDDQVVKQECVAGETTPTEAALPKSCPAAVQVPTLSEEERKKREQAYREKRDAEFQQKIASIPAAEVAVSFDAERVKGDISQEISYSNFTTRSSLEKLGRFVVIDTETTGLRVRYCDIIQVAAIKFEQFKPVSVFCTYLKPHYGIRPEAEAINHITAEMVEGKPEFYQIRESLQNFVGDYNLVGHNLGFDLKFLRYSGFELSQKKSVKFYDTLKLSRLYKRNTTFSEEWYDEAPTSCKLVDMCDHFGISYPSAHDALCDCYVTAKLFANLIDQRIPFDIPI